MPNGYEVAAYYFPQWHADPQNEAARGKGWSEWESLKKAMPRFPGHEQPKTPLWGCIDEADPAVSQKQIDAAADHGIDVFLFDWYWDMGPGASAAGLEGGAAAGGSGPFLHRALEEGFLRAPNRDRLKFALMWANHQPVGRARFDVMTDYIIGHYLREGNYWTVNGGLFFCVYELHTLIKGLGGLSETRDALNAFREKVLAAGLPHLHIDAMEWGLGQVEGHTHAELIEYFGFESATSYVLAHNLKIPAFPAYDYGEYIKGAPALWDSLAEKCAGVPYFPNTTMGWDPSPRVPADEPYIEGEYPRTPILKDNKPELFELNLRQAKAFVDGRKTTPRVITVYAWNEWTEGGYLEPDTVHGMGYLEAIKRVFLEGRE